MSDILVECDKRCLAGMLNILKRHQPLQIQQYNFIYNYLYHYDRINANREKLCSGRWNLRLYTHRQGKAENCTLISICDKKDYTIIPYTLQDSQAELKECLQQTKLIDWDYDYFFMLADETIFETVNNVAREKLSIDFIYPPTEVVMHATKNILKDWTTNPKLPDGVYLGPLNAHKHSKIIDDNWDHKARNSEGLIKDSIAFNGGVGLFRQGVEQPICWATTCEFLTPGFLYTLKSARGQGFGGLVTQVELKRVFDIHDMDLSTFVAVDNIPSLKMHEKLGFKEVNRVRWIEKPQKLQHKL